MVLTPSPVENNDIQVWTCVVDSPIQKAALALLSGEEKDRMAQMGSDHARQVFAHSRASLRFLLGESLACDPRNISLAYNDNGKPELARETEAAPPLHFNLSHAGAYALIALSSSGPVGVDLEKRGKRDYLKLAQRFFAPPEIALLEASASPRELEQDYLRLWTAKESMIKALGLTIGQGLRWTEIGLNPLRLFALPDDGDVENWRLTALDAPEDMIATLASSRSSTHIQQESLHLTKCFSPD